VPSWSRKLFVASSSLFFICEAVDERAKINHVEHWWKKAFNPGL
jgi:hypothetical protein